MDNKSWRDVWFVGVVPPVPFVSTSLTMQLPSVLVSKSILQCCKMYLKNIFQIALCPGAISKLQELQFFDKGKICVQTSC